MDRTETYFSLYIPCGGGGGHFLFTVKWFLVIHKVAQPSPLSNSRVSSLCPKETPNPLGVPPIHPTPDSGNADLLTFYLYRFDDSQHFM